MNNKSRGSWGKWEGFHVKFMSSCVVFYRVYVLLFGYLYFGLHEQGSDEYRI